jgi:hypothetical protein
MACPDCGSSNGEFRIVTSIETHGLDCGPFERFDEEFIVCRECGGRFDTTDWDCPEDGGVESANQLAHDTSPAA